MGEIIFSVVIGACLVLSGIILITSSNKEANRELKRLENADPAEPDDDFSFDSPQSDEALSSQAFDKGGVAQ